MGASRNWRSPKAWFISATMVGLVWLSAYFLTGSVATATTISVIFVLIGLVGVFYT